MADFTWNENKNLENQSKHQISFQIAPKAFLDPDRIIYKDLIFLFKKNRLKNLHCQVHI